MLKINLLPRSQGRRGAPSTQAASYLLIGVVGTLVALVGALFLFHASQRSDLDAARNANTQLQGQIDAIKSRVSDHQKVLDELSEIHRREEAIEHLQAARTGPTSMLVEMSNILSPGGHPTADPDRVEHLRSTGQGDQLWSASWDPHRVWLTNFEEENRNVKISGEGRTPDDVGELMRRLNLSLYFQNVRLDRTEATTQNDTHLSVQRFTINARVRY